MQVLNKKWKSAGTDLHDNTAYILQQDNILEESTASSMQKLIGIYNTAHQRKKIARVLIYSMLKYTVSFQFNQIMMALNNFYIPSRDMYSNVQQQSARKYIESTDVMFLAQTRLLAYLTTTITYNEDLIVYRGFADKRSTIEYKTSYIEQLSQIKKLESGILQYLKKKHRHQHSVIDILNNNQKDILRMMKDPSKITNLIAILQIYKKTINLQKYILSKDIDNIISGVGNSVVTETFMSTSLSLDHAQDFVKDGCCLIQIKIPAGTPCLYVSAYSNFTGDSNEFEIILPPCAQLSVIKKTQGITYLRYEGISDLVKNKLSLDKDKLFNISESIHALNLKEIASLYITEIVTTDLGGNICKKQNHISSIYKKLENNNIIKFTDMYKEVNSWEKEHDEYNLKFDDYDEQDNSQEDSEDEDSEDHEDNVSSLITDTSTQSTQSST